MVIFDSKTKETGSEHVAIATSKCVPSGIFLGVQHPCQVSIALLHYWRRFQLILYQTTVPEQPMTSSVAKFAKLKNLNISGAKKDITKRKTPFYSTLKNLIN